MSQRAQAISRYQKEKISELNHLIQAELDRQQQSYERGVRICEFNPNFLKNYVEIPKNWQEFEKVVVEVIPQILVFSDYITIHTTFGVAYDYDIPAKPDRTNNVDMYQMSTFDVVNMFIGQYLKEKYTKIEKESGTPSEN